MSKRDFLLRTPRRYWNNIYRLTDPSETTRREDFWIDTLKTRYPLGLNNVDVHH